MSDKIPEKMYFESELDLSLSLQIGAETLQAYDFYPLCPVQVYVSQGAILIRPIADIPSLKPKKEQRAWGRQRIPK